MTNTCAICGRPTPDGYACVADAVDRPRQLLAEIQDMLPAALDVAHRQARHGTSGGGHGKPGSALPIDLGATARLDGVRTALTTWGRHIAEERGVTVAGDGEPILVAARWLADHCEWMRHREECPEFLGDIRAAHRIVRGIAEPAAVRVIVGLCDCSKTLYAAAGRQTVTCKDCQLTWDVDDSRDALRGHLDDRLVTAAEAAHLAGFLDTDRSAVQIRKLVNKWSERGVLAKHGDVRIKHQHRDSCPAGCAAAMDVIDTYRFGDIAGRIADTPTRAARAGA
ncbi:MAG TPA: hypothetical protein VFY11_12605 [Nocardioidaceae bacterium]|nr:hypothetical protein [Nocardioidaceae bacterium]